MTGAIPTGWTGHRRGSVAYRRVLIGLFFAGVATFAQLYSPQAVLPQIAAELRVTAPDAALTVSAATIGLAIGVIPWSAVADRVGRVRAMVGAVSSATVLALLVPLMPSFPLFLVGRGLEGLALGGVPAIAIAYLTEEIDSRHTARAAGTYVAGTTIGGLAGRLIAGPVGDVWGWRAGVFAVAIVCACSAAAFIVLVPRAQGFSASSRRRRARSVVGRLVTNLRDPRQLALYAQAFLLMGGFVALYNYLGFRLTAPPFLLPTALASLIFIAYLAGTWSSAAAGAIAGRFGRLRVLVASIVVMGLGVAGTMSEQVLVVLGGLIIATAGFFGAHAIASGWTGHAATTGRAQASSLYNLFYYAGSSLFGWLGGFFYVSAGWTGTAVMVLVLTTCAGAVALFVLRSPREQSGVPGR